MEPKLLSTKKIFKGRIFDLNLAQIEDEGLRYEREIIEHPGSAVVLPLHSNGDVTLVRQYRYAASGFLLEIPAGTVEDGESPEQCAAREIEEETGLRAGSLTKIAEFYVSPGFLTEKMHLFFASDLSETTPNRDFDENIEVVRIPLEQALDLIHDKMILDAKTIIGILLASNTKIQ